MTYKLEAFVEKIKSPVICNFGNEKSEFADGIELAQKTFDKYWLIDAISVQDGKVVLELVENRSTNTSNWLGEEAVEQSFF